MANLEKRLLMASPSNLWSGRDLLMTYFHCGTFLWKTLTILLTLPIRSTLQSGLLVKRNLATIKKNQSGGVKRTRRQFAYGQFN